MAAEDANAKQAGDWKKKESFGSAFVQIIVVAALLAGVVYFVYQKGTVRTQVEEKLKALHAAEARDTVADLKQALKTADEILALDSNNAKALGVAAGINTELWLDYKEPKAEADAKAMLSRAEAANSLTEGRYASRALILLHEGKAKEAEDFIEEQRKKGASSPRLFYAQAEAIRAQGNLKLAKTSYVSAMDKAWKNPFFACGYGDASLAEGLFGQATDAFNKAVAANPDHQRALIGLAFTRALRKDKLKDAADGLLAVEQKGGELSPGLKARLLIAKAELANIEARYDDAVKLCDEAIAADAENPWSYYVKARALGLKKDPAAVDAFNLAVSKDKNAPLFYLDGAGLLEQMNKLDEGLALLSKYEANFKAVKNLAQDGKEEIYLDRDDRYWIAKGDILRSAGKLDDALAAYEKGIDAKALNQAKAIYSKATIFVAKKDLAKAAEIIEPIVPPDGTGTIPEAYMIAGDLQFQKKEWPTGCQYYAFALTNMKNHQVDREKLNGIIGDIETRLKKDGQNNTAKAWKEEASKMIQ